MNKRAIADGVLKSVWMYEEDREFFKEVALKKKELLCDTIKRIRKHYEKVEYKKK
jgi:hypothetical protein